MDIQDWEDDECGGHRHLLLPLVGVTMMGVVRHGSGTEDDGGGVPQLPSRFQNRLNPDKDRVLGLIRCDDDGRTRWWVCADCAAAAASSGGEDARLENDSLQLAIDSLDLVR